MKNLVKNAVVFIALTFAFSSLISCSNTVNIIKGKTDGTNSDNSSASSKSSEFPPVSKDIMQADIKDVDNGTFKLEDRKGKIVLINLWATWCAPCREEMPSLVELQNKYKGNNFEIIGLDSDEEDTPEAIKTFSQKAKLNYQLGYADAKMMNNLLKISKFNGIPQSFLIDREGKLRNVFVGGGAKNVALIKEAVERVVGE